METPYDTATLQSLLGYGRAVHERSGGVCQLCGCGIGPNIDFDVWRQFTVEHLIGEGQGGYPARIRSAVNARFGHLADADRQALAARIQDANLVTACHFFATAARAAIARLSRWRISPLACPMIPERSCSSWR